MRSHLEGDVPKTIVTMTVEITVEDYTPEEIAASGADAGMEPDEIKEMQECDLPYEMGDLHETFQAHFDVAEGEQHTALDGLFDGSNIYARPTASKIVHFNAVRVP